MLCEYTDSQIYDPCLERWHCGPGNVHDNRSILLIILKNATDLAEMVFILTQILPEELLGPGTGFTNVNSTVSALEEQPEGR